VSVRALLASLALALVLGVPAAWAQEGSPRAELARLAVALDDAVGQVSAAAEVPVVGQGVGVRAIPLRGFGAVFVVPARALPAERSVIVLRRDGATEAAIHQSAEALAQREQAAAQARLAARAAAERAPAEPRRAKDRELEALELQAEVFQREAERARQEAERALESIARELRVRVAEPSPPERPAAPAPPEAAESRPPSPPAPPWRFWFRTGEEDARHADQVVTDVKQALIRVLQDQGPDLRSLKSEEQLVVAVDFSSGLFFGLDPAPHPQRSLLVRVRKGDLDDRRAGRISPQELQRRIEQVEY
jgi:hypothetical protein